MTSANIKLFLPHSDAKRLRVGEFSNRTAKALAFAIAVFLRSCAAIADPLPIVEKSELAVGDRWAFRAVDLWKNQEVSKFDERVTGLTDYEVQ